MIYWRRESRPAAGQIDPGPLPRNTQQSYQSLAPRPASRQDRHGGVAFSCRHLLLIRRHLALRVRSSMLYRVQGCTRVSRWQFVRTEPAETATMQLDKHAPSAGDWSPAFDGTGRGRFRLDLGRRHAWRRRHRRRHHRGAGGLRLDVHLDASRPGEPRPQAPSSRRAVERPRGEAGCRGCLFVPGRNLQHPSRFPVLLAGSQCRGRVGLRWFAGRATDTQS